MAPRLSELLERIRPAGTPGAPTEGELQRRDARRAEETASVIEIVAGFEAEAEAAVAEARGIADRLLDDAHRRARMITGRLPDHLAVAEAEASQTREHRDEAETELLRAESDRAISTLRDRAEVELPRLVDEMIEVIWSEVPSTDESRPGP